MNILVFLCSFIWMYNNKTFKFNNENSSYDSKWVIHVIFCPICKPQYVGQSNNFRTRTNGHKSYFRLYAVGKINKMDNKLLYDHLIYHNIDYIQVCTVGLIPVDNNNEHQVEELLRRKEHKWIWDLGSITPYGLNQDYGFYCKNKRCCCCCWSHRRRLKMILSSASDAHGRRTSSSKVLPRPRR